MEAFTDLLQKVLENGGKFSSNIELKKIPCQVNRNVYFTY